MVGAKKFDLLTRLIKSGDRACDAAELRYTKDLAYLQPLDVGPSSSRAVAHARGYLAFFCAVKGGED